MRIKSKTLAKVCITTLLVVSLSLGIFTKVSFATEEKGSQLKDENGQVLKTGKKYYIAPDNFKKRGLTFEVYNNWDYVLATNAKNDDKIHGTPVQLYVENTNEADGLDITTSDKVILKMQNYNWAGYKYLSFNRTGGHVWLDKAATTVSLEQDDYKAGIAMNAGANITKYYDAFGRITGPLLAKSQVIDDTYLYMFNSNQVFSDPNKLWLSVYMRRHFTIGEKKIPELKPKYFFSAVN